MQELPTARVIGQILLLSALLTCAAPVLAVEPVGAVAPAHGPMLMLYVTVPLGSRGAGRIYGLRLHQVTQQPTVQSAATAAFYTASSQRSLIDLQIRRQADVRVEFGDRLTWNVRRREFELPNTRAPKAIDFVASAH
jgi:hypothetical protein